MSPQRFEHSSHQEEDAHPEAAAPAAPAGAASAQRDLSSTDDLLADIDAVLESNAEEFVRGFVQKGGQ